MKVIGLRGTSRIDIPNPAGAHSSATARFFDLLENLPLAYPGPYLESPNSYTLYGGHDSITGLRGYYIFGLIGLGSGILRL